ncbi:MAG TPA: DUF935 family protein [Fimbriimonas sp.]
MNLRNLFRKPKSVNREVAPQLTVWDRRAAEAPSAPTSGIPYLVYDQMERDSMIQTALTVKKLGVLAAPFHIESCGDSTRDRFIEEAFARMEGSPASILNGAMDAFAKGWSIQELVFEEDAGRLWLRAARPKDPALFGLNLDAFGRIEGLSLQVPGETPRDLPIGKFVLYRHRGSYGRPKGRSDLDAAYPHWQAKNAVASNWRLYLARFANPTILARCGPGTSSVERNDLVRSLANPDGNLAVAFPNEIEVQPLGGTRDASSIYIDAIDFHNREIARAILGQTLTTDEGRRVGSLAMGKVHLQVLALQLEAIRRELSDAVMNEQVIRPLIELNFGPGPIPKFAFERTPIPAFTTGAI